MTDKDKRVDETLKKQIQEAYGASDEQLKARMDRIEKTLTDDEFAGAEDRIMAKLMARIGAMEPKEEKVEPAKEEPKQEEIVVEEISEVVVAVEETVPTVVVEGETVVELEVKSETVEEEEVVLEGAESVSVVEEETSATTAINEEKVVRFGRKKAILVAALAAAFIGALAVTTIGENSYFFREDERRVENIFDSGKNISNVSSFEMAYKEVCENFDQDILALNHLPEKTEFIALYFDGDRAILQFNYQGNEIFFSQRKSDSESSINMNSDREKRNYVENDWLGITIEYTENKIDNDEYELEAEIDTHGIIAMLFGKMEKHEFEEILKNIYLY